MKFSQTFGGALLITAVTAQQTVWGQCGGKEWTGPTTCEAGSACVVSNDYYSQCIPGDNGGGMPTGGGGDTTTGGPEPTNGGGDTTTAGPEPTNGGGDTTTGGVEPTMPTNGGGGTTTGGAEPTGGGGDTTAPSSWITSIIPSGPTGAFPTGAIPSSASNSSTTGQCYHWGARKQQDRHY